MATTALVAEVLAAIGEEAFSLEHMIIHRGVYETTEGPTTENEFDEYVRLMTEIKTSSEKAKGAVERILKDPENLKYADTRLADYGDLMKRLERLNSAVDELEYKVIHFITLLAYISLDYHE